MITKDLNTEFWVISDTHLIANSLHDEGQAFSQMQKTSQGKDLYYQETALTAFMRMAQRKSLQQLLSQAILLLMVKEYQLKNLPKSFDH